MKKAGMVAGFVLLATNSLAMAQTAPSAVGADPRAAEAQSLANQNTPQQQDITTTVKTASSNVGKPLKNNFSFGPDIFGPIMAPLRRVLDPIHDDILVPTDRVVAPVTAAVAPVIVAPQPLFFDRPKPIPVVAATASDATAIEVSKPRKKHRHKKVTAASTN